ncbi:RHS repeat-associated core domain-containing protein [Acinetobacter gerneri]|uniref:RHS repeat-associated core domain-containing protein n=1 Tax=Acinetobacter gerneri TaxID=202952 RepID=A0AAW8JK03_9GAMM|nr:RHS repeat-associated core domain-containing protein [Acinetobacter gerneri]MDQ9011142.1 RHS repeat-associated core domain-containing protein [Acinetobacter gerneri]MDQ9015278.1 RHS repeat-associated core domain-containing protein [Acinetobacter gerneri]MDQ9026449.1 RHS repeat-associated core domain-containing protein [Acinetobacter gerneri]MDQ9053730.1 RHS repeat-associated core domain-containing protein [Acinetobacter gerneri]MDQ9061329.1 RHS repeat-associated core domain-containing prote
MATSADVAVISTKDKQQFENAYKSALARVDKLVKTKISSAISVQYLIDSAKNSGVFPVASVASGAVVSTLFPIVDVIEDLICLYDAPKNISNWIFLGIDILCFIPITMVVGRSLKFAMHTVKPAVKNGKKFSQACQEAIKNIVAAETIAAIEIAIQKIQKNVEGLKKQLIAKINQIFDFVVKIIDAKIGAVGISGIKADLKQTQKLQKEANKYGIGNPLNSKDRQNFLEFVGIKTKQAVNLGSAAAKTNPVLLAGGQGAQYVWKNYRTQILALKPKIGSLINRAIGTVNDNQGILAILGLLLGFIRKGKSKTKAVQPKQENKAKQTTNSNQPIRKRQEDKPKNNPNDCDCVRKGSSKQKVGGSISFALGTEIFSHQDFDLPYAELLGLRTYSSYLSQLDDGIFGARWVTPLNKSMQLIHGEWVYLQTDGRSLKFPDVPVGHSYLHPIEDLELQRIAEDVILIKYLDRTEEIYKKQGDVFALQLMHSIDGQKYEFYYDHIHQGKAYLSDVIVKSGDEKIYHLVFELGRNLKVQEIWLKQDEEKNRKLAEYQYDRHGDLIKATTENNARYQYQYDHHLITRYTDLTDRGMNLRWDGQTADAKAIHEWIDGGSDEVKLEWADQIRATSVFDSTGAETLYYYTENGYTYRTIYPDGTEEWWIRDAQERIQQHIQSNGSSVNYEYDNKGNLLKLINEEDVALYYGYDEDNNLTHYRDGEGHIWRREYDDRGNLTEEIDPLERSTKYQYNSMGLPVSIQDAKGGTKQLSYNKQGQLTKYTDCSGKATTWQYDERGRLKQTANALNEVTEYFYTELDQQTLANPTNTNQNNKQHNAVGQLERIKHADGTEEHFIHDAEGRLLVHIDPKGQRTKYDYDLAGRISKRIDAAQQILKYHWDKLGRLSKLSNENGASYHFQYDVMGRLLKETDFDGKETIYHYSETSGELQRSIELAKATNQPSPIHRIQAFEFDAMGRLIGRTAGFSAQLEKLVLEDGDEQTLLEGRITEEFAYDGNGQLIQAKNPESRVQYFYDEVGNLRHGHHHDHKTQRTAVWQHLYDELNNRTTTHRPDGQKVDWLLYGSGHVYGLALNGEDSVSFKRDDLHREIERHYANGISQQQQYDKVGRLILQNIEKDHEVGYQNQNANAQTQTKALLKRLYHYDKVGQLTDIHDKRRGHIEYKYDPVGRLLQANSSLGRETFAFDPASNIINPNKNNQQRHQDTYYEQTHKHGYNSLINNVVKDYLDQKYQYDDYGQLIRQMNGGHIQYFEWDALGRLIRSKNDKAETHYRYDALGRRIEKLKKDLLSRGYSETTQYGWDGDTLAFESGNQYTKHYVYEMGSFVPLIQATYRQQMNQHQTPQWEHGYDYDKDPLWHTSQKAEKFDRVWFYHCDHLGTPQEMSDQTGAIVWTAEYKAWGECKPENHLKRDIWDSEIITNNIRFQGQYYDDETGLHYNRFRYYSPYVGRFISKDPIGLLGGINTFAYAPNPVEWTDPLGLACETWLDKAKNLGHAVPLDMSKPHGHHIVFKGSYSGTKYEPYLKRSKSVLMKYGIDPVNDPANLMIANNGKGVHTVENAKKVAEQLEKAHKEVDSEIKCGKLSKSKANIKMRVKLQQIGQNVFGGYR